MSTLHAQIEQGGFWLDPTLSYLTSLGLDQGHCLHEPEFLTYPTPAGPPSETSNCNTRTLHHDDGGANVEQHWALSPFSPDTARAHGMASSSALATNETAGVKWTASQTPDSKSWSTPSHTNDSSSRNGAVLPRLPPKTSACSNPGRRNKKSYTNTTSSSPSLATPSRRSKKLERSRLAATKFRKRSKESAQRLELDKEQLEDQHSKLRLEFRKLNEEVIELKNLLMCHARCQDDRIDAWITTEADTYAQRLRANEQRCCVARSDAGLPCAHAILSPAASDSYVLLFPCPPPQQTAPHTTPSSDVEIEE